MVEQIDIAMTPAEAEAKEPGATYIVIDAVRATTTIAALFHRGLRRLRVVGGIDEARRLRAAGDVILFGEEGGLRPWGFDYGNSPAEAATLDLEGREAILMTSNGTKALCAVANLGLTAAGALVNLTAIAAFAETHRRVVVVCSGNAGARTFSLEDFAVGACIVQLLQQRHPAARLGDAALLAIEMKDPARLITRSEHADVMRRLQFDRDLAFVMSVDRAPCVPLIVEHGEGWAVLEAPGS